MRLNAITHRTHEFMTHPTCSFYRSSTAIVTGVMVLCGLLSVAGLQFYEDGMDSIAQTFLSNLLVDGAVVAPMATGKWLLIDRVLLWLQGISPIVDWYGAAMFLFMGVVAAMLIKLVRPFHAVPQGFSAILLPLAVISSVILFAENLVLIQYTRVAYLLCIFSMLLVFEHLRAEVNVPWFRMLGAALCFALGALIRMEAAALAIFMVAPLLLFIRPNGNGFLGNGLRVLLVPVLLVVGVSSLMLFPSELDDDIRLYNRLLHNADGLRYEASQLGVFDSSDALAYEMTLMYFMNDPVYINDELIARAGISPMTSPAAIGRHLAGLDKFRQRVAMYVPSYVAHHWGLLLFALCCFLCAMVFPAVGIGRRGLALLFLSYLLLALLIAGYIKIEDRVFNPMLLTWSLVALMLSDRNALPGRFTGALLAVGVTLSVGAEAWALKTKVREKQHSENDIRLLVERVSSHEAELVIIDTKVMAQLHQAPFRSVYLSESKEYFSIDNGILFLYPGYHARAVRLFGTVDAGVILSKLAADKSNVFVSTRFRATRIVEYFNRQHALSLEIDLLDAADGALDLNCGNSHGLVAYKLR